MVARPTVAHTGGYLFISAVTVVRVTVYLSRRSHSLTAIYEQSSPLRPFGVLVLCLLLLFLPPSTRSDVAAAHTQFAYIALERPAPSLRLRAIPMCVCISHSVPSIMMCQLGRMRPGGAGRHGAVCY